MTNPNDVGYTKYRQKLMDYIEICQHYKLPMNSFTWWLFKFYNKG